MAINPNAKTPALTDGDVTVFGSNAILLYLAEKSGQILAREHSRPAAQRAVAVKAQFTFKTEMDDDARKAMFPQNARLAGKASSLLVQHERCA